MKFSSRTLSVMVALSSLSSWTTTSALPIETCATQFPCLDFTLECIEPSQVCTSECEYIICMTMDFSGSCVKDDTVSHTCNKDDDVCAPAAGFRDVSTEVNNVANGDSQCQVVPPGGVAEFLVKDGNAANGCGSLATTLGGGAPVTCETFSVQSCTGRGNIGQECVWRVTAPSACGKNGGGGGDPHVKLWNRTRYSYHGECDLVLLQNQDFADGLGMDIHVRTTQKSFYSYIESAALRIGDDVLEVMGSDFWINGVLGSDADLPTTMAGYFPLHFPTYSPSGKAKFYQIDLNNGDNILIRSYSHFMSVDVLGRSQDFGTSAGLMGDYHSSQMLARDGTTVLHNADEFGSEWQVQGDEAGLFRTLREPQHPWAACKLPETTKQSRHLRQESDSLFVSAAETACANKVVHDFEFCVHDVLATKDIGMAEAW